MRLERFAGNPILVPIPGHDWESRTVFNCGVAQTDGAVVLLYRAQGTADDVSWLGLAVSTDGVTFARLDRPVFEPGDETETFGVEDPRLTTIGDEHHMLYTAWSPSGIQVAMATTRNFFTWRRRGIVIPGPDNKDAALFPEKVGGRYVMFHRIPLRSGSPSPTTCCTGATMGRSWTRGRATGTTSSSAPGAPR